MIVYKNYILVSLVFELELPFPSLPLQCSTGEKLLIARPVSTSFWFAQSNPKIENQVFLACSFRVSSRYYLLAGPVGNVSALKSKERNAGGAIFISSV